MIYDDDADLALLGGKTVAIIGYGSQGHAHSLNLRDSGVEVVVGLRDGSASIAAAREAGLEVLGVVEAASRGDVVMILAPDELHHDVWEQQVRDGVAEGNLLLFGHGFSIHYGEVVAPPGVDVALVAPKGPGHLVRRQYTEGSGVPGLVAIHQDATGNARALALAYAKGIGCTRGGVIETSASRTRPRPICSASRRSSAVARRSSSRPDSRRSSRPATTRRWRTSNASTS